MDSYPKTHIKAALLLALSLGFILVVLPSSESPANTRLPVSLSIDEDDTQIPSPAIALRPVEATADTSVDVRRQSIVVASGDNMSSLFKRAGLSPAELHQIMQLGRDVNVLKRILPGKRLLVEVDDAGKLKSLRYEETPLRHLLVTAEGDRYQAHWEAIEPEIIQSWVSGTISGSAPSLYHAGKQSGLSDNIIMKLSYIFQWDVSFAFDLREGDTFSIVYEEVYVDGEKLMEGDIVAAQFSNSGKTYRAVRYTDAEGRKNYYTPDGHSMRKAFLRDPVHFSYVSSSFNLKRLHPIHKVVMPHRGIDYAAKKGTPILASGDGKVTIARQNNASGMYVVIQHGEQYTTKYLHMSRFGKGIRPGKLVSQGDVIGYVGDTGWATAPHLHYEFLVNGVHRNPKTVALPQAQPIATAELDGFLAQTRAELAKLDSGGVNTSYASTDLTRPDGG